jgi:hypothetical protein
MSRDFGRLVAWLNSLEPRMYLSDLDLVEMFWRAHPRFNFFKSLPWGANLLDIGAGNGGLVYWKDWLKPAAGRSQPLWRRPECRRTSGPLRGLGSSRP